MRIFKLFILLLLILSTPLLINSCLFKKKVELITIIGNELDIFLDPSTFTRISDKILNLRTPFQTVYRYYGHIQLAVHIPENHLITDLNIRKELIGIFEGAINHLRLFFEGRTLSRDEISKVLICCIELSIRMRNTKYFSRNDVVNCYDLLGYGRVAKDMQYAASSYTEEKVLEITIL